MTVLVITQFFKCTSLYQQPFALWAMGILPDTNYNLVMYQTLNNSCAPQKDDSQHTYQLI